MGASDLRIGDGISVLGDESVQGSGEIDRWGRSCWSVGLEEGPIIGVDIEEEGG